MAEYIFTEHKGKIEAPGKTISFGPDYIIVNVQLSNLWDIVQNIINALRYKQFPKDYFSLNLIGTLEIQEPE